MLPPTQQSAKTCIFSTCPAPFFRCRPRLRAPASSAPSCSWWWSRSPTHTPATCCCARRMWRRRPTTRTSHMQLEGSFGGWVVSDNQEFEQLSFRASIRWFEKRMNHGLHLCRSFVLTALLSRPYLAARSSCDVLFTFQTESVQAQNWSVRTKREDNASQGVGRVGPAPAKLRTQSRHKLLKVILYCWRRSPITHILQNCRSLSRLSLSCRSLF